MITIKEGDIVDFSLVTDTVLGGKRSGSSITAEPMNYSVAVLIDPEIKSKHSNLYSFFKDKVDNVDDPAAYKYFVSKRSNGTQEILGIPWVSDATFKPITTREVTYVLHNFQEQYRATIETMLSNLTINFTAIDSNDIK